MTILTSHRNTKLILLHLFMELFRKDTPQSSE